MTILDEKESKRLIATRIMGPNQHSEARAASRATVKLDQHSVGRLSRMDALQQQAMAPATEGRRAQTVWALQAALWRIDKGEFGLCADCGDNITPERLRLNPAIAKCISYAKG